MTFSPSSGIWLRKNISHLPILSHLRKPPYLKFHRSKSVLDICRSLTNLPPLDARLNSFLRFIEECHHSFHHPQGLPHRTVLVVLGVTVLLQEVLLDE
ncbi:hypothetical protein Q9L58_006680 [Maublancomyces gigas]|uniref:Uncharacterized protein n=1 Tax=Discina gigas TaxID=1032678 RepID=A0ABR3GEF8_9PEZI